MRDRVDVTVYTPAIRIEERDGLVGRRHGARRGYNAPGAFGGCLLLPTIANHSFRVHCGGAFEAERRIAANHEWFGSAPASACAASRLSASATSISY